MDIDAWTTKFPHGSVWTDHNGTRWILAHADFDERKLHFLRVERAAVGVRDVASMTRTDEDHLAGRLEASERVSHAWATAAHDLNAQTSGRSPSLQAARDLADEYAATYRRGKGK